MQQVLLLLVLLQRRRAATVAPSTVRCVRDELACWSTLLIAAWQVMSTCTFCRCVATMINGSSCPLICCAAS